MFFPSDSLRRGGRFYICWIADSWPWRFSAITQKQLWSYDIRKICDDLLKMMNNESGRHTNRFSLRLSSQLLRGLVRVFAKKTNLLLGNLHMINANVSRNVNKRYAVHIDAPEETGPQTLEPIVIQEQLPGDERNIEELLLSNRNVVGNLQDITLRDNVIPEKQLPNDGFGEENQEQTLQILYNRTIEEMLHQPSTSGAHSGLDLLLEVTDKTQDRSRLIAPDALMERISEHDVTVFGRASDVEHQMSRPDFEKDIPEIPEIPPPELPAPDLKIQEKASETTEIPQVIEKEKPMEVEEIELEEIEEQQVRRRRRPRKLIIDKRIRLSAKYLRSRISNVAVDLRCEKSSDDRIDIRVPGAKYLLRPCHGGDRIYTSLSYRLENLFKRKLGTGSECRPLAERELQEPMMSRKEIRIPLVRLETVREEEELVLEERSRAQIHETSDANLTKGSLLDATEARVSVLPMEVDISNMLTQKLETVSQQKAQGKRGTNGDLPPPKRIRAFGVTSSRHFKAQMLARDDKETTKENIPEDIGLTTEERQLREMLHLSGLADMQRSIIEQEEVLASNKERRAPSQGSETPLGSLDRTKVSLGDSETTTASRRFLRDEWGTEGTVIKIVRLTRAEVYPVTVNELLRYGPIVPGMERFIAAKCFTSILKLITHGFIRVQKDPETSEIEHIRPGTLLAEHLR